MTPNRISEGQGNVLDPILIETLRRMQDPKSFESISITEIETKEKSDLAGKLAGLEPFCGFIPIKANSKASKVAYVGKPYLKLKECLSYKPSAIAVRSEKLICLDYDREESLDYVAGRGIDFTYPTWHIRKTDNERFKTLFVVTDEQRKQLLGVTNKINFQGVGLDVFPQANPYIIVLGQHQKSGHYFSPNGLDASNLAPPPKEVWELFQELLNNSPKGRKSNSRCNSEWIAARPCPICGRDKDDDCRVTRSGGAVLCHHGNTFHPPHMRKGEIISGSQWAYCGEGESVIGTHSIFRIHKARRCLKPPTHKYRRQTHAT